MEEEYPGEEFEDLVVMGVLSVEGTAFLAGFWTLSLPIALAFLENLILERELWVKGLSVLITVAVCAFHVMVLLETIVLGKTSKALRNATFQAMLWQGLAVLFFLVAGFYGIGLSLHGRNLEFFWFVASVTVGMGIFTIIAGWQMMKNYELITQLLPDHEEEADKSSAPANDSDSEDHRLSVIQALCSSATPKILICDDGVPRFCFFCWMFFSALK